MSNAQVNGGQAQADWLALAKAQQERLALLEAAVRRPLPEGDIRGRQGKAYLSGGDILLNLLEDFGPFAYETTIKRLEWTSPREDRRQREVNKKTGEVLYDTGWTCVGVAVVTLVLTLPDGRKVVREGSGTCGSDMQPSPEGAIENAVKGAETDALKRACVGLGPRYGLALRFNDRDDDRVALGLVERNKKVDEARARRDAEQKNKAQPQQANPPEKSSAVPAPAAGVSPAASTNERRAEGRPVTSAAPPAGMSPAGAPKVPQAADDAARREALRKAEIPADVKIARDAAAALAKTIQDTGLRERAGASIQSARTLEQVAITRGGIEKILAKQEASKPDPTTAQGDPATQVPATGSVSSGNASTTVSGGDVDERRLQAGLRLMQGDYDPALSSALKLGGHPENLAGFDDLGHWPPDPQAGDLREYGWVAKGAAPDELALIGAGDPVPLPLQQSVVTEAVRRLGRDGFVPIWKGLGGPSAGGLCSGYQLRLIAFATAYRTQVVGATK